MVLLQIGMLMTLILACGWEFVASMEKYKCCKPLLCDFSLQKIFLTNLMIMVLVFYYENLISFCSNCLIDNNVDLNSRFNMEV